MRARASLRQQPCLAQASQRAAFCQHAEAPPLLLCAPPRLPPILTAPAPVSAPIALAVSKSMVILDVKPWDDETDLAAMEKHVRSVEIDGLLWGSCALPRPADAPAPPKQRREFPVRSVLRFPPLVRLLNAAKLVPIGFGIKKLQITAVIHDVKARGPAHCMVASNGPASPPFTVPSC